MGEGQKVPLPVKERGTPGGPPPKKKELPKLGGERTGERGKKGGSHHGNRHSRVEKGQKKKGAFLALEEGIGAGMQKFGFPQKGGGWGRFVMAKPLLF